MALGFNNNNPQMRQRRIYTFPTQVKRRANWLDSNDNLTARTPSTATHAQHIVDECKTRGLI